MTRQRLPGRDPQAVRLPVAGGAPWVQQPTSAVVVGGGIAGLAAAIGLAERGVRVQLVDPQRELGGRARAWRVGHGDGTAARSMSRGFHAFFRQYYNLRALLSRAGTLDHLLVPIGDYPVLSSSGDRDSFARIPRVPPCNFAAFVARSPTFRASDLARVELDAALSLLDVDFPKTFEDYDGISAAEFLDRLRFPKRARHLALEVFARSFFADPRDFAAGELIAMFHSYFLGSSEGLLFDVPRDDYDTTLWKPIRGALERLGGTVHLGEVERVEQAGERWSVRLGDGAELSTDAVVLAAGPEATPRIVNQSPGLTNRAWRSSMSQVRLAPEFAVWRLWTDRPVREDRPAFLGTAGFGPLDNVSVLERFERGASLWAAEHGGSVIELHAYALTQGEREAGALRSSLLRELVRVYPETADLRILADELLIARDCPLIGGERWATRPGVATPHPTIKIAGDWVRSNEPIALMERAATTGWMAANQLLETWGVAGHPLWSVPTRARQAWPSAVRRLLRSTRNRGLRS